MREIKFRTPVKCQNGHKAFWHWEPTGLGEIKNHGVSSDKKCNCPKFSIGEGYKRDGDDQQYTGLKDKNGKEIYENDIVFIEYNLNHEKSEGIVKMIDGCWSLDFQHLPERSRPYDPYKKIIRRFDYLKMFTTFINKSAKIIGNIHE